MTRHIIVSRHSAAIAYITAQLPKVDLVVCDICSLLLVKGDCVYGNLPIHRVAELTSAKVRYFHLSLVTPMNLRGEELTGPELMTCSPVLKEYKVL